MTINTPLFLLGLNVNSAVSAPAPFTPASISPAIWFDPSDFASMFQDTAATTPVTATTQSVARINNKGTLGGSLQQATAANRPTLQQDASGYYLSFDGVNDSLVSAATMDLSAFSALGLAVASTASSANNQDAFSHGNQNSSTGIAILLRAQSSANTRLMTFTSGNDSLDTSSGAYDNGVTQLISVQTWDITQASAALKSPFRINGIVPAKTAISDAGGAGTVFGNNTAYLGTNPGTGFFYNVPFRGLIIKGGGFSAAELANVETWLGAKAGLVL